MTPRTNRIAFALLATAAIALIGAGCGDSGSSSVDPERFVVAAVTPASPIDGPGDVMLIRTEADGALPPSLIVDE